MQSVFVWSLSGLMTADSARSRPPTTGCGSVWLAARVEQPGDWLALCLHKYVAATCARPALRSLTYYSGRASHNLGSVNEASLQTAQMPRYTYLLTCILFLAFRNTEKILSSESSRSGFTTCAMKSSFVATQASEPVILAIRPCFSHWTVHDSHMMRTGWQILVNM